MSVINRRNAVIGWVAWTVGKRAATYAAKDAAKGVKPAIHPKTKKPNKSAIMLAAFAVVGCAGVLEEEELERRYRRAAARGCRGAGPGVRHQGV